MYSPGLTKVLDQKKAGTTSVLPKYETYPTLGILLDFSVYVDVIPSALKTARSSETSVSTYTPSKSRRNNHNENLKTYIRGFLFFRMIQFSSLLYSKYNFMPALYIVSSNMNVGTKSRIRKWDATTQGGYLLMHTVAIMHLSRLCIRHDSTATTGHANAIEKINKQLTTTTS